MRRLTVLVALAALASAGCLCQEYIEYDFTPGSEDQPAHVRIVRRHLESDAADAAERERDYATLVGYLRSDAYLAGEVSNGLYVKSRRLAVERGELVSIVDALADDVRHVVLEDGMKGVSFADADSPTVRVPARALVATDGLRRVDGDTVHVTWPPAAKSLRLVMRDPGFAPDPHSDFAKRWLRAQHRAQAAGAAPSASPRR